MVTRVCSVDDCEAVHYAKDLCKYHYGASKDRVRKKRPKCVLEWCSNPRNGATYCKAHEDHIKAGKEPQPLQARRPVVDGKKECSACGVVKPVSEYNKHATGIHPKCRECYNFTGRLARYGLQPDELLELLSRPCDSCGMDVALNRKHVDHHHASGAVRGVLCHNCNLVLGLAHEDPGTLRAVADYIERFS